MGLRNEVGLRADKNGNLWGIENGMDNLFREDLGGDIHLGNPGEELVTPAFFYFACLHYLQNLLSETGKFYGYPYCWSQYNLTTVTTPRGTQYALPDFIENYPYVVFIL